MGNPLDDLFRAFARGKGAGHAQDTPAAAAHSFNPMQSLFGALLAGKGSCKGSCPYATATAPAAAPVPTGAASAGLDSRSTARVAFEESVADLVNMGLVTDPQMARELLTQHGDISTVVSMITESES